MNKEEYKKYLESLPPGVREDALKGGKTKSPMSDAAMLLMIGGAIKAAPPAAAAAIKKSIVPMLRKEWANRTLNRGAWEDMQQFGIQPKGVEGWAPWNAFRWGAGGGPQTGPTPGADKAIRLMINTFNRKKKDK